MRGWGRLGGGGCCDPGRVSQVTAQWLGWPGKGLPRHPLPQSRAPLPADLTSSCASYTPPSILVAPPDPANPSNSAPALSHLLQEVHRGFPAVCLCILVSTCLPPCRLPGASHNTTLTALGEAPLAVKVSSSSVCLHLLEQGIPSMVAEQPWGSAPFRADLATRFIGTRVRYQFMGRCYKIKSFKSRILNPSE